MTRREPFLLMVVVVELEVRGNARRVGQPIEWRQFDKATHMIGGS